MDRQTHYSLGNRITNYKLHAGIGHSRLFVQGDRVMHGSGNAGLFQLFLHDFAVGDLNCVLGPGAGVVGC